MKNIQIIKRNHQKEDYRPEKIAIVIKKGFDSVNNKNYSHLDIHFIYQKVKELVEAQTIISVEEIQDLIEKQLLKNNYIDVYESFFKYRLLRAESRQTFNQKHNVLLRPIDIINQDPNTLLKYNQIINQQYALQYRFSKKIRSLFNEGIIYIDGFSQLATLNPNTIFVSSDNKQQSLILKIQSLSQTYQSNLVIDLNDTNWEKENTLNDFLNNCPPNVYFINDNNHIIKNKNQLLTLNNHFYPIINAIISINLRRITNQDHFEEIIQLVDEQLSTINIQIKFNKKEKHLTNGSIINLVFDQNYQIITTNNIITHFKHQQAIDYFNQIDAILNPNIIK